MGYFVYIYTIWTESYLGQLNNNTVAKAKEVKLFEKILK